MNAQFDRFVIQMTMQQALTASPRGQCDIYVAELVSDKRIQRQLRKIGPELIRSELREYGAWGDLELSNDEQNQHRIVWSAACTIREDATENRA